MMLALLICLLLSTTNLYGAATFTLSTRDPANDGAGIGGFSRNHWTGDKMLSPFGSGPVTGDNSLRAYDPVSNTWGYLWPNGHNNGGVQNRDNQGSFYIPRLNEYWVWGGSHLEEYANLTGDPNARALCAGRFSVSQKEWIKTSVDCSAAFSDVLTGGIPYFSVDPATAWSSQLDMGAIFGGTAQGNPQDVMAIIEPNGAGGYITNYFTGPRPPARDQAMNLMVAAGTDFYLFGGSAGAVDGVTQFINDFWKFDGVKRIWTQLATPPAGKYYQATLTYDSDRNLVLAYVAPGWSPGPMSYLYVYDPVTNTWNDVTPSSLPCLFNQMGVYMPTTKTHAFQAGISCSTQSTYHDTILIKFGTGPSSPINVLVEVK